MLVDSNSQRGSVVLRGIEIGLDTDIGRGFVIDCARFTEGLLPEDQIKSKYGLSDNAWARLADNAPLVRAVETEKTRRVHDGAAEGKGAMAFCPGAHCARQYFERRHDLSAPSHRSLPRIARGRNEWIGKHAGNGRSIHYSDRSDRWWGRGA